MCPRASMTTVCSQENVHAVMKRHMQALEDRKQIRRSRRHPVCAHLHHFRGGVPASNPGRKRASWAGRFLFPLPLTVGGLHASVPSTQLQSMQAALQAVFVLQRPDSAVNQRLEATALLEQLKRGDAHTLLAASAAFTSGQLPIEVQVMGLSWCADVVGTDRLPCRKLYCHECTCLTTEAWGDQ